MDDRAPPADARSDIVSDYGLFVVAAIEHRKEIGVDVFACSDEPTFVEAGEIIGKANGKEITTVQATREQFEAATSFLPQSARDDLREMLGCIGECASVVVVRSIDGWQSATLARPTGASPMSICLASPRRSPNGSRPPRSRRFSRAAVPCRWPPVRGHATSDCVIPVSI